jgi:penicillin-binding protein 1A
VKNKSRGGKTKAKSESLSMKLFKFIFKWGFFAGIWAAVIVAMVLFYYLQDLPSLSDLETQNGKQVVQINYSNDERITNRGDVYVNEISYYELPPNLINAVVATEDRRFFNHHGVDFFGIIRAFYVNREAGRIVQGGSTITQQLAKLLFLKPERTAKRKIQEILLAVQLERHFTKEQILTFYLSRAYFGSGNYGVQSAAKHYFGKDVSQLNLNESALLAGLLKAPSKLSPKNNRELAESRTNVVLKNMIEAGFLNEENFSEITQDPDYKSDKAQRLYFTDFVFDQFPEFLSKNDLKEKVISVTSTLDEKIQEKLEDILDNFLTTNSAKLGKSQLSAVVMKKDGAVVGIIGGKDYQQSQFNRAIYAKRQAGSAFKTFVYLTAFENGMKTDDVLEDKKINVGTWLPENYENRYLGEVTLQQAFANSLNSISIQLAKKFGGDKVAQMAHKCGITSKIDKSDPTIALGTTEVSLFELVGAYATIANNGEPVMPYVVSVIRNGEGLELYKRESSGLEAVISPQAEESIKKVMREVVERGTGKNANIAENIYGKTGTSQNFRDAWFVGFNDEYVVGVWIGNDDNSATNKITGGSLPASLFAEIMGKI